MVNLFKNLELFFGGWSKKRLFGFIFHFLLIKRINAIKMLFMKKKTFILSILYNINKKTILDLDF
jgi:hypothetical protein